MKTPEVKKIIIRERIGRKPSVALVAMCDGLVEQDSRLDFQVNMDTYGESGVMDDKCYGCAATCAVLKLLPEFDRVDLIDWSGCSALEVDSRLDRQDLDEFEEAINSARKGYMDDLFVYCYPETDELADGVEVPEFNLDTHDWKKQIPTVRAYAAYLAEHGH